MPRFGGAPKCKVCNKAAYEQESQTWSGTTYHKTCFKCTLCNKRINTISSVAEFNGDVYHKNCFKKQFKESGGRYGGEEVKSKPKSEMTEEEKEIERLGNMAGVGTQEDKDLRKAAASTEAAWENAGQKVGLDIWRIEKFKVVAWPRNEYGSFYTGDSYIILRTYKEADSDALLYDLHFWLGATSSQDEMGTAAYKTVELDDFLDQKPVQYREVQGHESDKFLELFPSGIRLMEGGVESGFNKVKPEEYKPRLMHIKGKNNHVRVNQVELALASLNHGDAFILDNGLTLYQWHGKSAGVPEKNGARDQARGLSDLRNGRPKTIILDGCEDEPDFWALLGCDATPSAEDIAPATADDEKVEEYEKVALQISDDSGELLITEVARGAAVNRSVFGSDDSYILDVGSVVYAFVGINASKQERSKAVQFACDYLAQNNRPNWTPIQRVLEGGATTAFDLACQ